MDNQQANSLLAIPNKSEYFCDSEGNIISTKRSRTKVLKPHLTYGRSKNPYLRVRVDDKLCLVHRLIVSAMIGRELKGDEFVNHKDGVTTNNRMENLELVSHRENVQHAVQNNLYCSGVDWHIARGRASTTIPRGSTPQAIGGGNRRNLNK